MAEGQSACKLLELSAELRNRIYEYALAYQQEIVVDRQNFKQPDLLRTCKQIRCEAAPLYYLANDFVVDASGFDPTMVIAYERQKSAIVRTELTQEIAYRFDIAIPAVWSNLLAWLKAYHKGEVGYFCQALEDENEDEVDRHDLYQTAARAFKIVDELQDQVPWGIVEKVLEHYKEATQGVMMWQ